MTHAIARGFFHFRRHSRSAMRTLISWIVATSIAVTVTSAAEAQGGKKIRVVIVDGWNNHKWPLTTPILKKALEDSGKFTVEISTSPKRNQKELIPDDWKSGPFPPDLTKFDVILSNYNGPSWPMEMQKSLDEQLKAGKIGLAIVHAANNSFENWEDYRKMVGMGWYNKKLGDRLFLDEDGKRVIVPKGEGDTPNHRYVGKFTLTVRDKKHPITKDMPVEWLHNDDELYDNMRGPIENVHLLATAYSKGTKAHEPMIWTIEYGKGRVFHTPMGHDVNAMRCVGFQTTVQRGAEWAATGQVTIPIPENFPTADKASVVPKAK
jgi:type 1 glutamine amidotransferase